MVLKTETRKREMSVQRRHGDNDRHDSGHGVDEGRLILPLDAIDHTWLSAAGGKAANLGDFRQSSRAFAIGAFLLARGDLLPVAFLYSGGLQSVALQV